MICVRLTTMKYLLPFLLIPLIAWQTPVENAPHDTSELSMGPKQDNDCHSDVVELLGNTDFQNKLIAEFESICDKEHDGDHKHISTETLNDLAEAFDQSTFDEYGSWSREYPSKDWSKCRNSISLSVDREDCTYQLNYNFKSVEDDIGCSEWSVLYIFTLDGEELRNTKIMFAG